MNSEDVVSIKQNLDDAVNELMEASDVSKLCECYQNATNALYAIRAHKQNQIVKNGDDAIHSYSWLEGMNILDSFVTFPCNTESFDYIYRYVGNRRFTLRGKTTDSGDVDLYIGQQCIGKIQNNVIVIADNN